MISSVCEAIWLRNGLQKFGYTQSSPIQIFINNKSTTESSKNLIHHGRSKHVDTRYYFIHEVKKGQVELFHCNSEDQIADIFIKSLQSEVFQKFRENLGIPNDKN